MAMLDRLHQYGEALEKRLRLRTYPLAVKMLKKEDDIPEGTIRPKRDWGHLLLTCQAFSLSRRDGMQLALLKEDMWCSESVIGLGLAETPQFFLEGRTRYPEDMKSLEAASVWAHNFPRLEAGKYIGIATAPLMTTTFEPDLAVIYCVPEQIKVLLSAVAWRDGREVKSTMSGKGACVFAVAPLMQTGECQVTIACGGDMSWALTSRDELIFSAPIGMMEDLLAGLKGIEGQAANLLPRRYQMKHDIQLPESYFTVGRMMGMDV